LGSFGVDGGFAEYCVTRARYALKIPGGLTLREAVLAQSAAVVIKGLRRLGAAMSGGGLRRCAVVGADAVGHLAVKILLLRGCDTVVFGTEIAQLECLQGVAETRRELGGFESFDLIVETTGDQRVLATALQQSRPGATLLLLASSYEHQDLSAEEVASHDKTIVGAVGYGKQDLMEAFATLQGLDLSPLLQRTFPMEEFKSAWSAFRANSDPKVMLNVDPGAV
jgi:threonine dehydrogenase-like Zn-dependent dehydrogenase